MKKILSYITILLITLFLTPNVKALERTSYTNLKNISMTSSQYNNLQQLGFNEKQIARMDIDTFNANKDIQATKLVESIKYYKTSITTRNGIAVSMTEETTEEEALAASPTRGIGGAYVDGFTETYYKMFITSISEVNDYTMRYMATMDWIIIPSTRSYDIIGLGFQQYYVQRTTTAEFQQEYTYSNGTSGYSTLCTPKYTNTGVGMTFKLPSGSLSELSSYIYYGVGKVNLSHTVTNLQAGGDYSHAVTSISQANAQNYTISHNGLTLSTTIDEYYDDILPAVASWYGTW